MCCDVLSEPLTTLCYIAFHYLASCFTQLAAVCFRCNMYSVLIFMPPKKLWEAYSNRTVRPPVPLHVRCISPIFFEVGIPNLVCGCIWVWRSVAYHFPVTVTLTSDLVFIVIKCPSFRPSRFVSGAYLLYSLR